MRGSEESEQLCPDVFRVLHVFCVFCVWDVEDMKDVKDTLFFSFLDAVSDIEAGKIQRLKIQNIVGKTPSNNGSQQRDLRHDPQG